MQKAIEISAMETAAKDAIELQHQHKPDSVHKVCKKKDLSSKTLKLEKRACFRCDRKNYTPEECFKNEKCRFCSMTGHIENACLKKKAEMKKQSKKKPKNAKTVKEELLSV